MREINHLPILATMIITPDDLRSSPNTTAVLLDFPLETQLLWIRSVSCPVPAAWESSSIQKRITPKRWTRHAKAAEGRLG